MKKMKKIVAVILLLTLALSLTACNGNSGQSNVTTQPVETQPKSAIDELNETELYIYTAIKENLTEAFVDPAGITLLEISEGFTVEYGRVYYAHFSGTGDEYFAINQASGDFWILGRSKFSSIKKSTSIEEVTSVSVGNINRALFEYFDSMGWR